jgi:hypothetical protein
MNNILIIILISAILLTALLHFHARKRQLKVLPEKPSPKPLAYKPNQRRIVPVARQTTHNKLSLIKRQYHGARSREKVDGRKRSQLMTTFAPTNATTISASPIKTSMPWWGSETANRMCGSGQSTTQRPN